MVNLPQELVDRLKVYERAYYTRSDVIRGVLQKFVDDNATAKACGSCQLNDHLKCFGETQLEGTGEILLCGCPLPGCQAVMRKRRGEAVPV